MGRVKNVCCECGKNIKKDEKALSMKLLGTDIDEFYCLSCLSEYLECDIEDLKIKIKEFKEEGCTLFL